MIGRLPLSLPVGGREFRIRTDYRDMLVIMQACSDPELTEQDRAEVMMTILYEDFDGMRQCDHQEAFRMAAWFIDCGQDETEKKPSKKLMDWEQDEQILFPAINKVAHCEVRAAEYIHWWTFMGYFMEIEDGTFSTILGIRQKLAKGKSLEKWEREFYRNNKSMCEIKKRYTQEEQAEIDYWNDLLG